MNKRTFRISANMAVFALSIYMLLVFNVKFWQHLLAIPFSGSGNIVLWLTMPLFICAAMTVCMQILFWPGLHKLTVPLILLAGSAASYGVMTQDLYFNSEMIQNIIQTDTGEASAWITPGFLIWLTVTGVLPASLYLLFVRISYNNSFLKEVLRRIIAVAACFLIIAAVVLPAYGSYAAYFRNNKQINHQITPTNILGASIKTAYNAYDAHRPFQQIGTDAAHHPVKNMKKKVFVLVVGETTRAQNWELNGYTRPTTSELKAMGNDVTNFMHVSSCGTSTAVSVPCLFSDMSRKNYDANKAKHQEGLMDIVKRAGLSTLWIENDGGCKGACDRIRHIKAADYAPANECVGEGCYDMNLITKLKAEIDNMPGDGVIVLHTMGSHGPAYYQRYPAAFRHFTPTCDTNQIQQCTDEQLRNTYDNTVRYIDHMLASTIEVLKNEKNADTALWYFSDHGESLGEKGMYLHAAPYSIAPAEQTRIPMIFWSSRGFMNSTGLNQACLQQEAQQKEYSHDNIFHSMLGIMDISTKEYDNSLDIFDRCRNATKTTQKL